MTGIYRLVNLIHICLLYLSEKIPDFDKEFKIWIVSCSGSTVGEGDGGHYHQY